VRNLDFYGCHSEGMTRVGIDYTVCDVTVIDERDSKPVDFPQVSICMDSYTHQIIAVKLGGHAEDGEGSNVE